MSSETPRRSAAVVELVLNAMTAVAAIVFVIAATQYAFGRTAPKVVAAGSYVSLRGVPWAEHDRTLLLVMQPDCAYSETSVPLYRDIVASTKGTRIGLVAVFPQPETVAREVLRRRQLEITDVKQEQFDKLGVPGSPTLVLVDKEGKVLQVWVGQLSASREADLFAALKVPRRGWQGGGALASASTPTPASPASPAPGTVTADELARVIDDVIVIDTRDRDVFSRQFLKGARNIPADELEARLPVEIPRGREVALFCADCYGCATSVWQGDARTMCDAALEIVRAAGVTRVRVIAAGLEDLRRRGIGVEGAALAASHSEPRPSPSPRP
jgi:hypothetical protein